MFVAVCAHKERLTNIVNIIYSKLYFLIMLNEINDMLRMSKWVSYLRDSLPKLREQKREEMETFIRVYADTKVQIILDKDG